MSVPVIGASEGGLSKAVVASLAGLLLSRLLLDQASAAEPPAAEPPAAEPPAAELPPAEPPPGAAPAPEAPPAPPPIAPPSTVPVETAPTDPTPTDPVVSEAPPASAFEPSAVEPEALAMPRDSIFDAGYGTRGDVTVAIGGVVDALDPRAAAGASLRVPQFSSEARFGLGRGWSTTVHLNTILAINELDAGVSFAFPLLGDLRGLVQFQAGVFVGMLGGFGFESLVVAPQFRPLVGVSLPTGNLRWSVRAEVLFSGPYSTTLGDVTSTLATPPAIANWNVALLLENLMDNDRLWYAGLVLMASTGMYQNWLLFPDTSRYDYYPRVMGGYEF
jgi:hypothetical protein